MNNSCFEDMIVKCDKNGIDKALSVYESGGIIIFPTDTVYGVGCNPYLKNSVKKIYEIKSRPMSKPFPILVDSIGTAEKIVVFNKSAKEFAKKFWPGQLTMILELKDKDLGKILSVQDKIAVRVPNNNCTKKLLKKCKFLIGTSANVSGQPSFIDPEIGKNEIENYDIFIDGGKINGKGESTIIEFHGEDWKIIREGALRREELS
ncbi:MAG: L-threonylcarbamoyladenylate synthase [Nitrosopumilus sp.]